MTMWRLSSNKAAKAQLDVYLRDSNIGIWEIHMPDGILESSSVDLIHIWEQLGYDRPTSPTDFATPWALIHPDDQQALMHVIESHLSGASNTFETEFRARHSCGKYRWFLTHGLAERDATGKPVRFVGSSVDITEHIRAEDALRASEERFRRYFDLGLIGMAITSPTKGCIEVNEEICRILGYSRNELLQKTWPEMTFPVDVDADVAQFNRVMAGEIDGYSLEKRWVRKDGQLVDSIISVKAVRRADGAVDYFVALLQDVTERRRAEQAIRESEERFRSTFDNAAVGIANLDLAGRWLRINDTLCEIVGYSRDELVSKSFQEITYPDDLAVELNRYVPLIRGDIPRYWLEKRFTRKDGATIWVEVSVSLLRDAAGMPAYIIKIVKDVSERKRLESELLHAKEAAEAANRAKDEFLANVSHEIRTPLNVILGMTELVLDSQLTDDQRQDLETVASAGDNLLGIINELLDFSKIEAGKLELIVNNFSLRTLVREVLRALDVDALRKNLQLAGTVEPDVRDAVLGDANRLRQVLLNLVGNAIKFTERGSVALNVKVAAGNGRAPNSEGKVELEFIVSDTGIGISSEKQRTIFEAFEQEDVSITRRYGGTGLGLTIAARLVDLMGGKIAVDSEPGRGSKFAFSIELGLQPYGPERQLPGAPAVESPPLRILVAEDNVFNQRHLKRLLNSAGTRSLL